MTYTFISSSGASFLMCRKRIGGSVEAGGVGFEPISGCITEGVTHRNVPQTLALILLIASGDFS